ncbi:MAG TPA: YceI family protein [Methylophilaceae bacterium]|nr:YceI family protein [Methylophilaceae bacterium]
MKPYLIALSLLLSLNVHAEVERYKIDGAHSFANWSIRHVASKTSGTFNDIRGEVAIDRNDLANSKVDATISLLSVNSGHAKRDEHIQKEEYLDVSHFAEMRFVSTKVVATGKDAGTITGQLTLHGVTKEITFPFKVLGFGNDPWGGYRSGFEARTSLRASDYGFTWPLKANAPVGDDIEITLLIEGVRAKP